VDTKKDRGAAVAAYKVILQRIVDNRPSGTRHRLAEALGKNRSFVSQITSPAYSVPIPPGHLDTIFEICHFTPAEKSEFLAAYALAHSRRPGPSRKRSDSVTLTITLPDLGDARANRALAQAIEAMADVLARLAKQNGKPS
jgi:hypothetical protein